VPEQKPGESRVFAEGATAIKGARMSRISTESQEKYADCDNRQGWPVLGYPEESEALASWFQRGAALRQHLMRITRFSTKRRRKEKKKSADDESGSDQDCPHGDLHRNQGLGVNQIRT
jgi:hypothetical protein